MGETYSMRGREEECMQGFGGTARRKETTRETDVDGRIILKCMLEK
jgi:hypothetical protein